MPSTSHTQEVDGLRADLSACFRALSSDRGADGPSIEALVTAFMDRSTNLQRAFAVAAISDGASSSSGGTDPEAVRAEVAALRAELAEKDRLLAVHRTNVQRWLGECDSVQQLAAAAALDPEQLNASDAAKAEG